MDFSLNTNILSNNTLSNNFINTVNFFNTERDKKETIIYDYLSINNEKQKKFTNSRNSPFKKESLFTNSFNKSNLSDNSKNNILEKNSKGVIKPKNNEKLSFINKFLTKVDKTKNNSDNSIVSKKNKFKINDENNKSLISDRMIK